ncbi:MAG: acetate--CoA ligase family protein [Pseudomonadota bacterium]
MSRIEALNRLLRPESIAVAGGDSAAEVIRQCQRMGYDGELWAVSPSREELAGIRCVPTVADLPGVPDATFVAAPPGPSLQVIDALSSMGAAGAVCFAAGFAETGDEGAELQAALNAAAGNMAIIGPNCYGFLNYLDGVALWPDEFGSKRCQQGAAVIMQSGNIAINMTMQQRGIDFAYVISIGNKSVLSLDQYIDALIADDRVTAIGLHIEGLRDVAAFSAAALRALDKGVPIVALKTGRSTLGAEITMSHTGSLAGSDRLYSALFERLGIARATTVPQFLETLKFMSMAGPIAANTIGSMSCSGGEASLVADYADRIDVEMPALTPSTAASLKELLGPNVHVANPLDYHLYIWGHEDKLRACFTDFLSNEYGCAFLVLDYPDADPEALQRWETAERALQAAAQATGQPGVIVSSMPENFPDDARERVKAAGMVPMQGIEDSIFAMRAAAVAGQARQKLADLQPVAAVVAINGEAESLDEWQGKQALADGGVVVPNGRVCSRSDVVTVAIDIGFPVVVKALDADLAHKSEAGAVAINLRDAQSVGDAVTAMPTSFDSFLVEEMVTEAVAELIVGISRDATFGLTLLVGSGGTLVELMNDTATLLLPASRADIETALSSLKCSSLLAGFRGKPAGNMSATVDAIERIAEFAMRHSEELLELDVNPLIVTPSTAVAADTFMRKASS